VRPCPPSTRLLPFVRIYSLGEVLRSGVGPSARFTALTIPGYIVMGLHSALPLIGICETAVPASTTCILPVQCLLFATWATVVHDLGCKSVLRLGLPSVCRIC